MSLQFAIKNPGFEPGFFMTYGQGQRHRSALKDRGLLARGLKSAQGNAFLKKTLL